VSHVGTATDQLPRAVADPLGAPVVLVAHGSRDPAAARSTLALRDAVRAAQPGRPVLATFLDFAGPRLADTLVELGGPAVVVPLLLTEAYHGRIDVPGEVARARTAGASGVRLAPVLGPVRAPTADTEILDLLVRALLRRLPEPTDPTGALDGVVLAGAGSRHLDALRTVDVTADALGAALGVPALAGYASGAGSSVTAAVAALRGAGASRIGLASYFLAPGLLYDRAVEQGRAAGVVAVAPPLDVTSELVEAVLLRARES
jgi:sirohydrochlorin ferrochelatase